MILLLQMTKRYCLFLFLVTVFLGKPLLAQEHIPRPENLPEDVSIPVMILDFSGGFRAIPDGFEPTPFVSIFADGRVVTGINSPELKSHEVQLPESEFYKLFNRFSESGILEMDSEAIQQKIEASGKKIMIMDAPTSNLTFQTKDDTNTVSVYALSFSGTQLGDVVPEVKKILDLERQLRRVQAIALLGGSDELSRVLDKSNEYVRGVDEKIPPFKSEHLYSGFESRQGNVTVSFVNSDIDSTGNAKSISLSVTIDNGDLTFSLSR
ncbi:MAG: hypothetical protein R3C03_12570 [Pirellulaceae bacterium]